MNECPELGALEVSPLSPELRDHVSACNSCKLVVEVFDAAAGSLDVDDCIRFDALLAARSDGTLGRAAKNLLERHLASCATCREVAQTLSPTQDADGDHATLPRVEPEAYALGLEVARGGMGRVIAARDLRIGRPIAIKELLGRSPQLAARFEREARVTARLQHPGIVPIYEIGKWPDGTPFYSMRMVDGRMLAEAIESAKTLNARLALLPAVIAATEAVAFAHAKRVIHRDLTPSNILVGAYGETVVIDWGLAKDLAAEDGDDDTETGPENSSEKLTGAGAVIGTATYMPPEQAHAIPVDERADVYALGAILYHVLAGAPPYRAKTAKELLRAVKTAPPPPIERVQPGTPRDLVSIITKAMARDPDARYPSARELAEELVRFQTGRLVEAHAYSRYELVKRFLRRHRAAVTVSALALAISVSFGTIAVVNILDSRAEARRTVRELILERGRAELHAGNSQRALAYLWEAYQQPGDFSPTLQFLLGSALRRLSSTAPALDCGGSVRTIAFDPHGKYIAAGCTELAKVWRLADGQELAKLETGDIGYGGVRFSNDGTLLATWGESGVARLWSPQTGELRATLAHRAEINRLSFTPDDARVLTTGTDGLAILWDVAKQAPARTVVGSAAPLRAVRSLYGWVSPDGRSIYATTPMGVGNGWDIETGESLGVREHGAIVLGGDLARVGERAVTCGVDGRVRVWDLEARTQLHELAGHTEPVWKCIFSSDGKLLLSGGHDGRANIYDLATGQAMTSVHHGDIIINADFSPDARRFATTGIGGEVKLWDTRTGALLASLDSVRGKDARFAPDNERLAVARGDGRIQMWKFEPPAEVVVPVDARIGNGGAHVVYSTAVSGAIEIRDLATKRTVNVARELGAPYAIAEAAPFVAGLRGDGVRVVDLTNASAQDLAIGHAFTALRLSADGRRLAVESDGQPPEVWDVRSRAKLVTLASARHAMLSEDGSRAIAWLPGQRPVVWDVDAKQPGATLATSGEHAPLGFARGGTRVALRETAGDTRRVSLWDASTGTLIAWRRDSSASPGLDPTRKWLTTIDGDHTVTVWSTDDGANTHSFLGRQLSQATVDPLGRFVGAIAEYGRVALLMSLDGRILARWPLDHHAPEIDEKDGMKPPLGSVTWMHDGSSMISHSKAIGVWSVTNKYSRQEMAELVKRHVPWRVKNGQLDRISNGRLHGVVMRDGVPQPNVKILVEIRTPPDIGAAPINWNSSKNRVSTYEITTDSAGEFSHGGLLHGEYTLSIGSAKLTEYVSAEDEPITIQLP